MALCKICGENEAAVFPSGSQPYCRSCLNAKTKAWRANNRWYEKKYYADNREDQLAYSREWRKNNPERVKAYPRSKTKIRPALKEHGIKREEYETILAWSNGGCAICGAREATPGKGDLLHIDHCHKTGKIRGLLCNWCNPALGGFRDDINLLKTAICYLEFFAKHEWGITSKSRKHI